MIRAALKHIQTCTLMTLFSTALAALIILAFHPAYASDDNDSIDGYELPSMFDDDISTPIADQSGAKPKQVPSNALPKVTQQAKPPRPAQKTANKPANVEYEDAFKPLHHNNAAPTQKVTPRKTANVALPIPRPASEAPQNSIKADIANTATIPAKEMPKIQSDVKPVTTNKATNVAKEEIYKLSEELYERTTIAVLPKPRPTKILARSQTAIKRNMPAVPPVTVAATPLAQPDFVTQQGNVKSISRIMALEDETLNTETVNNVSNISIAMQDLEDLTAPQAQPLDVTKVIEDSERAGNNKTQPKKQTTEQFDTTQAHHATLFFAFSETELADEMKQEIDTGILKTLADKDDIRIEILSYAQAVDDTPSSARRVSLARALALRTYLLSQKIDSHRIDVRALGNNTNKLPIDRIDVELIN